MKLSEMMQQEVLPLWDELLDHPFICQMAQGTLPEQKFRNYMLQDYLYLRNYSKIFAAMILNSDDFDEILFLVKNIQAVIEETLHVHVPYMKQLGITDQQIREVRIHPDNQAYTDYMIQVTFRKDNLNALTALLNCSWSYAYIAHNMVQRFPEALSHPQYGAWFRDYTSEAYIRTNQEMIDTVDQWSTKLSEQRKKELCTIFRNCSIHEMKFWDLAWNIQ